MAQMSDYLENALLNAVLRNTAYTSPATVYVALYTVAPGDGGGGTEVAGGAYARQSSAFGAPSNGVSTNSADVNFPVATADWGNVQAIGIFDALTAGNMLFYGTLTVAKTIQTSDQFIIKATNLSVTLQ